MSVEVREEDRSLEDEPIVVRILEAGDADAIHRIDRQVTGGERRGYLSRRIQDAVEGSDIRVSLVAEREGNVVGFLLGSVYYGEFGQPEPAAVIDTLGVEPGRQGQGIGRALVEHLLTNLRGLAIDRVQTQVDWRQHQLLGFLSELGFQPAPRVCLERATRTAP